MAAEIEIQRAIYLALAGIGLRVVDFAKQETDGGASTVFPYVEVGMIVVRPWDTARETGHEFVARVNTWSRSASVMELKGIQGQIYDCLHRQSVPITGHNLVTLQREYSDVMRAPSGAFQGVCEYRGLIEKS